MRDYNKDQRGPEGVLMLRCEGREKRASDEAESWSGDVYSGLWQVSVWCVCVLIGGGVERDNGGR